MKDSTNMKALFVIINAGFADDVIDIARSEGAKGATIFNARGEGAKHQVFMGITVDSEKEIILFLVKEDVSGKIMAAIKEKAGIKSCSHSVCFTMPVENIVGLCNCLPQNET